MNTYRPSTLPEQYDRAALEREFKEIKRADSGAVLYLVMYEWNAEPNPMVPNMVVLADGTNWNPGSGRGHYRRNGSNTAWAFIG